MSKIDDKISNSEFSTIWRMFSSQKKRFAKTIDEIMNEYNPKTHKVNNKFYRKDKTVSVPVEGKTDRYGQPVFTTKKVGRCRVSIPFQRVLVERSVGFLFANPVQYNINNETTSEVQGKVTSLFNNVIKDNKMIYRDKDIARRLFSECEVAELWYFMLDESGKPTNDIRMRICSPTKGDGLYPHFDEYDRMDAFARTYSTTNEDGTKIKHFDIYTDMFVYEFVSNGEDMERVGNVKRHGFTKIPVVYYSQEETEWECVQSEIERIEDLLSNWGDTDDYFGSPSYFCSGTIEGFAEKGEQGRVYTGSDGADMKVLSWDSSPTSMNQEFATLKDIVFSFTQTPDVSFETMKRLGSNTSGVAIRLMFTDPHMKAQMKIETFGEMMQRRINIILNGIASQVLPIPYDQLNDLDIEPKFTPYMSAEFEKEESKEEGQEGNEGNGAE